MTVPAATQRRTAPDPAALAAELGAIGARGAGSDAERRAARWASRQLRALGRRPRTQTLWVRPQGAVVHALCAALGIAGAVVSVDRPETGVALAAAGLVAFTLDLAGVPLLRRFTRERATQNVVAEHPSPRGRVRLILTADLSAPRRALINRVPWPYAWTAVGLAGVLFGAGARLAGGEGSALGIAQLLPTVVLILAVGAFLELAGGTPEGGEGPGSGAAVVLAVAAALDARPPRALAHDVVLGGAGDLGLRAHVRALRRAGLGREDVVVLHIGQCAAGEPRWWKAEGLVVPLGPHQQLASIAAAHAPSTRSGTRSGARVARAARWPALRIGTKARPAPQADPQALTETFELALAIIAGLDAELAAA